MEDHRSAADEMSAKLKVRRDWQYADSLRDYHIIVDGHRLADIEPACEVDLSLAPGTHTIKFKIDWVESPEISLDFPSGQRRTLVVSSNAGGSLGLYYITFGRRKYLSVSEVPS